MATQNGSPADNVAPSLNVLAQYIKDLSFENPNAPNSLASPTGQPDVSVQINVNARPLANNEFEVELKVDGKASVQGNTMFAFDLTYGGIFRIQGIPEQSLQPVVLIECPRLLFPFARQIVADAVRNGGFPPLMIDPVDFASLYQQRMMAEAQRLQPVGQA
ncbi:MAG: protein-export chaperone SecB [Rhizobiales bacterium 24-66-13]|jgi:preprotein translocase subunit SecB|uniref:protein-export chaperone SecB n=1 Tax=Roseixanthobacter finlandensis TaxID=3119922 RepID=UPI000BCD0D84|nr:MAG: protein-export chaperone SecB [Rhizobiales bacterium 35-66-30]OYZ79293.1 MAG: protein-export chaperone SecB [Rhizobiales bacterium 24-66-13]OZA94295.1 MAG: protein-export chaperone SecB [Rhizobiales bacterium 39-66-18]HQS08820.1 protein-export chaperone SecB [Xanthobacteraceae bacterium]HQS45357.1 protein-export chaperone SecB [Xanthobacteraceae bacterium]